MGKDTYYALEVSNEYDVLCFVKYLPECAGYGTQDHAFVGTAPTEINCARGELMLGRKPIGTVPVASINKGVEYTLRVTVTGNTFVGWLVGEGVNQEIVWKDEDDPFTYGTVGLRARRADVYFDYFINSNATDMPKPSLDVSCRSLASYSGFNVEVKGSLAFNGTEIPYAPILLSYSVTGGRTWEDLTLVNTAPDGSYSATWMPSVTGNYLLKAVYEGDESHMGTSTTVNLAVTQAAEKNVFSATSNSTVTSLIFNSETHELSFTVTGPENTMGYVDMYIPNSLIGNIANVKAYIDGDEVDYAAVSVDDSWFLHFVYQHSTHEVVLSLGPPLSNSMFDGALALAFMIGSILVVCVALLFYLKKRRQ